MRIEKLDVVEEGESQGSTESAEVREESFVEEDSVPWRECCTSETGG